MVEVYPPNVENRAKLGKIANYPPKAQQRSAPLALTFEIAGLGFNFGHVKLDTVLTTACHSYNFLTTFCCTGPMMRRWAQQTSNTLQRTVIELL